MTPTHNRHGERLDLSFHPGQGASCHPDHLVILGHGVTGNKDRPLLIAVAEHLAANGWPCLRLSFSGNGESEGAFADSNISKEIEDLTAVIDQHGPGKKIAYIGHSMGGAVGTLTAARDERIQLMVHLAGMVHTSNFVEREFGELTPDHDLMWDEAACPLSSTYVNDLRQVDSTLDAVKELRLPWLLIHGLDDDVVLPGDSQELYQKLRAPRELVEIPGADHSFEGYHHEVCTKILDWLEKHF
ncbi:alpha/beta fold hydrolase [Verrucomicrobiaceae bacterium N1E253]|uniref:Alpha/beta fold hydrolase n=1 Tax=Oceaniferula marina TaxID=2748318 RepID=A0A851GCF9_9BACT|nr:alpha/beta fold hydrolase [Oceaniferula marina]NWK55116.1 alpha/beta fold hydrolase [Oceaniferula marina]